MRKKDTITQISDLLLSTAFRILVLAAIAAALFYGARSAYAFGHRLFYQHGVESLGQSRYVTIEENESIGSIAEELKQAGVIEDVLAFKVQAVLYQSNVKPGGYSLDTSMSIKEILDVFEEGPQKTAEQTETKQTEASAEEQKAESRSAELIEIGFGDEGDE